jgi:ABC-type lipoprotein release transport system permease subunit
MFSPFERLVAMRYLRARRKEGFISVIAIFSFLGIMLGVATLIIVMAVMNGFRHELLLLRTTTDVGDEWPGWIRVSHSGRCLRAGL